MCDSSRQAQNFLHSDAVSHGRRSTYITWRRLAAVGRRSSFVAGAILLHSDAVSRGRRSTFRRGAAVFLRGRRNTFCTLMLFCVAGAVLSALRCCFAWQAQCFILQNRGSLIQGPPYRKSLSLASTHCMQKIGALPFPQQRKSKQGTPFFS